MKGLRAAKSDRLMERQQALGEKRRGVREQESDADDRDLLPESAAAIQPDGQ